MCLLERPSPVPLESESVSPVRRSLSVGCYATWACFGTAGVVDLHSLARRSGRSAERFCTGRQPARNLSPPRCQVIVNVEVYVSEFHAAHFANKIRDIPGQPPTRPPKIICSVSLCPS